MVQAEPLYTQPVRTLSSRQLDSLWLVGWFPSSGKRRKEKKKKKELKSGRQRRESEGYSGNQRGSDWKSSTGNQSMDCMGKQFIDGWGRTLRAESEALVSYFTEEAYCI